MTLRAPARLRIARATRRLEAMTRFYHEGLGLEITGRFADHDGYSGVILAVQEGVELELTRHDSGRVGAAPDGDDLLVVYLPPAAVSQARNRLESLGCASVAPLNPYWRGRAVTFEDPDGWRVVFCDATRR